jgi:hypothetical protein
MCYNVCVRDCICSNPFFTQCATFQMFNCRFQIFAPQFSAYRLTLAAAPLDSSRSCAKSGQGAKFGSKLLKEAVIFEPTKSGLGVIP